jgi:putative membrane protein
MLSALLMAALTVLPAQAPKTPAQAPTLDDATIVAIFDGANTADIETGQLAEQRGASKDIRTIGASLVRDHQAVRQQGRDLAAKLGVTPTSPDPNPYAEAHAKAMAALSAKTGADFDRAFLDHEIAYHQAVIDAVTGTLLPAIKNPELKAFVTKIAPAFQAHLDMIKAAKKQLGY